jgi:heme exporter protein A
VDGLEKRFGPRRVLRGLTFEVGPGEVVAISGPNGSGKSTLLQILCGLQRPTRGRAAYCAEREYTPVEARSALGFAGPALQLYDDLSAAENLHFFAQWRGVSTNVDALLERVGLDPGRREPLRAYSSGMRQRVKLAWAVMHAPSVLLLDEPGANLDADGRALVAALVAEHSVDGWVLLASNDPEELDLASRRIPLV